MGEWESRGNVNPTFLREIVESLWLPQLGDGFG